MVPAWPQTLGPATMTPYRSPTQYNHQLLTANQTTKPTNCKTNNPHTTSGLTLSGEPSNTSGATNNTSALQAGVNRCQWKCRPLHYTSNPHKVLYIHWPDSLQTLPVGPHYKCPTHWDKPPRLFCTLRVIHSTVSQQPRDQWGQLPH